MRITSRMMSRQVMNNLNTLYKDLNKYHTQASTGKAFQKASEDPMNAIRSMDISSKISRTEQYATNIESAYAVLNETETSLAAISDSITEVKNSLLKATSTTYNDEDRVVLAKTVDNMKENIIAQLNKEYAGKYIFGGYNTYQPPFTTTVAGEVLYNDLDLLTMDTTTYNNLMGQEITVQTGKSTKMNTALPGIAVTGFGDDNMINVLEKVSAALNASPASIDDLKVLTEQVDDMFTNVQNHISSVGSKAKNLEVMQLQIEEVQINLTELLSQVANVDLEEAVINYKTAEMVYNSALAVSAKIIQPTLVDFLR